MARPIFHQSPAYSKPAYGVGLIPGHALTEGLVGAWLFNAGAGLVALDRSLYRGHGTLQGGAAWKPTEYGWTIEYDGSNDYTTIPISDALKPTTGLTLAFRTRNYVSPAQFDFIVGAVNGTAWTQGYGAFYNSSTSLNFFTQTYNLDSASITVDPLKSNLVVGTWDGIDNRIFVNGVEGTSNGQASAIVYTAVTELTFSRGGSDLYNINGIIDWLYVWNRPISSAERQTLYADPYAMFQSPAINHFFWLKNIVGNTNLSANAANATWSAPTAQRVAVRILTGQSVPASWSAPASTLIPGGRTLTGGAAAGSWSAPSAGISSGKVLAASGACLGSWVARSASLIPGGRSLPSGVATGVWSAQAAQAKASLAANAASASWVARPASTVAGPVIRTANASIATFTTPAGIIRQPTPIGFYIPAIAILENFEYTAELDNTL